MTRGYTLPAALLALALAGCAAAPRPQVCQCACVAPAPSPSLLPWTQGCARLGSTGGWLCPTTIALPAGGTLAGPAAGLADQSSPAANPRDRIPLSTFDPCNDTDLAGWSEPVPGGAVWHPCVEPW